jgi:hypothetical protein
VALLSPPYALGSAGLVLSGKTLRLAAGGAFRNATAGVQGVPGVLYGPPGTMGELTLNSNTSLTVNPFRAVVQNTQDTTQGQYVVANDGPVTFTTATTPAVPTQDASQFRRAYVAAYVADAQVAGVASTATTDRAALDILPGPLAASAAAAAYPAVPPNGLILGELLIPPTGQAVTVTPYNQRTTARGAILPVTATGIARPGHDGDPGGYVGQYRDHPTRGQLQRWNGAAWAGAPVEDTGWVVIPTIPPAVVGSDGCAIRRVNGIVFFSFHITASAGFGVGFAPVLFPAAYSPSAYLWFTGVYYGVTAGAVGFRITADGNTYLASGTASGSSILTVGGSFPAA